MREQLRVLLVEDSPTQANVISKMIERQGGKPTLAKTGDQALKFVQSEYFDLMLVDLTLGKENSVQYISYFREARPQAVVAAMTAGDWDPTEELHYARTGGAQFALKKPFSEQEVVDLLTDTRMMLETQTRRMHVLVVDDSRTQRKMVAKDLRDAECRVSTAESVSEAVERLGYSDVDTVVMDIFMPGTDGIQGIQIVRDVWPKVGVVAISAGLGKEIKFDAALSEAEKIGADKCLPKPFNASQIRNAVRSAAGVRANLKGIAPLKAA